GKEQESYDARRSSPDLATNDTVFELRKLEVGRKFSGILSKPQVRRSGDPKIQPKLTTVPLLSRLRRCFAAGLQFGGDLYLAATHLHGPFPRCESRLL